MYCADCGRELITWDYIYRNGKRLPVCHGGYDCYAKKDKPKPVSPQMAKVKEHAARFAS